MTTTDIYAFWQQFRRSGLGVVISVLVALAAVMEMAHYELLAARGSFDHCGTGAYMAVRHFDEVVYYLPLTLLGWILAACAWYGVRVARCAVLIGIGTWFLMDAFLRFGWADYVPLTRFF